MPPRISTPVRQPILCGRRNSTRRGRSFRAPQLSCREPIATRRVADQALASEAWADGQEEDDDEEEDAEEDDKEDKEEDKKKKKKDENWDFLR